MNADKLFNILVKNYLMICYTMLCDILSDVISVEYIFGENAE